MAQRRKDDDEPAPATQRMARNALVSSIDVSVAVGSSVAPEGTAPVVSRPPIVVMEERAAGLAQSFSRFGFVVRPAMTGFEAISMVAERLPAAVVVGPGDPERRRILIGALRLRFPALAVIAVVPVAEMTAELTAAAAGLIPWPLPAAPEVLRVLERVVAGRASSTTRPPASVPPASVPPAAVPPTTTVAGASPASPIRATARGEAGPTPASAPTSRPPLPPPEIRRSPTTTPPPAAAPLLSVDGSATGGFARPAVRSGRPAAASDDGEPATELTLRPRVSRGATRSSLPPTVEPTAAPTVLSSSVLPPPEDPDDPRTTPDLRRPTSRAGIGPAAARDGRAVAGALQALMWSLDDSARYLEALAPREPGAAAHAAVVRRVALLIAELQVRADELD
jgi:hypothetical protein